MWYFWVSLLIPNSHTHVVMDYIWLLKFSYGIETTFFFHISTVPQTRSPHDLSNNLWNELSSPYTESSDENYETTTHVHEPFFQEDNTELNVTTQLSNDVRLHCRVNDLREKMVSFNIKKKILYGKITCLLFSRKKKSFSYSRSEHEFYKAEC
jgi:hypothetical protein